MSEVERRKSGKFSKVSKVLRTSQKHSTTLCPFQPWKTKSFLFKKWILNLKFLDTNWNCQVADHEKITMAFQTNWKCTLLIIFLLFQRLERARTVKHFMIFLIKENKGSKLEHEWQLLKLWKLFDAPPNPGPILCSWAALFGSFRPLPCFNTLFKTYFRSRTYTRLCLVGKLEHEKDDVCFAQVKKRKIND